MIKIRKAKERDDYVSFTFSDRLTAPKFAKVTEREVIAEVQKRAPKLTGFLSVRKANQPTKNYERKLSKGNFVEFLACS